MRFIKVLIGSVGPSVACWNRMMEVTVGERDPMMMEMITLLAKIYTDSQGASHVPRSWRCRGIISLRDY